MSVNESHILVLNTTPNESRSIWDLSSSILPYLLDRPFGPINKKVQEDEEKVVKEERSIRRKGFFHHSK
jgi:hypothetical protein